MSNYIDQSDPIHRTIENLKGNVKWEATHLINSFLGVIVYPWELLKKDPSCGLAKHNLTEEGMKNDGWPVAKVTTWHGNRDFKGFMFHMRNAVAHTNLSSISDKKGNIVAFKVQDKYIRDNKRKSQVKGSVNFEANFDLDDLKSIVEKMGILVKEVMP